MPNEIVVRPPFVKRGQIYPPMGKTLSLGSIVGDGGLIFDGSADLQFVHGPQVSSNIVIEWDLNNDGYFDDPYEDVTEYVLACSTITGRDWPSLLTGKASPGRLSITLDNTDNRFSYFNTSSPLNQTGRSLKTGRRLRVRTVESVPSDPATYAKDRFPRADGALGTPEIGNAWSGPLANDFVIQSKKAKPQTEGQVHLAITDVGATAYYVQARLAEVGAESNVVGLVYRYQDTSNYSLFVVDISAAQFKLINVVSGTPTTIASVATETYDDVTLSVLVAGSSVTAYHEGVPILSGTAIQTDETEVGMYASWATGDVRPEIDDFYVWDGLTAEVSGILWTGDVANLVPSTQAGPIKTASLSGVGWLDRMAGLRLTPMRSVYGHPTGVLVGNVLARSNLLHPPLSIAEGDITTGAVGLPEMSAIEAARDFEETEFGFLYESQEGPLVYESRSARDSTTTIALFSDDSDDQFHYEDIQLLDWRRDVVNRVESGVAPGVPEGRYAGTVGTLIQSNSGSNTDIDAGAGTIIILAGQLQIITMTVYHGSAAEAKWLTPPGWVEIGGTSGDDIPFATDVFSNTLQGSFSRTLARTVDQDDPASSTLEFTSGLTTGDKWSYVIYVVRDWFGSIADGIAVSDRTALLGMDVPGDDPPVVFPNWGPAPSMFLAFCTGLVGSAGFSGEAPRGYKGYYLEGANTVFEPFVETAYRYGAVDVENPGSFNHDYGGDDGWVEQSYVIAIRGYNGGVNSGNETVESNDLDSQDDHNAIRSYTNASNLFADTTDAESYNALVLERYADDRPLLRIAFSAIKSGAYRTQAALRRVGDRITLRADGNAGLGISGDFFIETIGHSWNQGNTNWVTTWDLSPVP